MMADARQRPPGPVSGSRLPDRRAPTRQLTAAVGLVIVVLLAVNLARRVGPPHADLALGPLVAAALVVIARRAGLTWDDLGLARHSWRRGAAYGAVAVLLVALVYMLGVAMPQTRSAFLDVRYRIHLDTAAVTGLLVVPIRTVLLEEVAFRGVLFGLLRRRGAVWASGISSALFGLWHIVPALHLGNANQAVSSAVGQGTSGKVGVVVGVVVFTGLAGVLFCELRRRSGSLFASVGLHWATNGLAIIITAVLWNLSPAGAMPM